MDIRYLGHSSFRISSRTASIVCDPYAPDTFGTPFPKVEANIVTISHAHNDHNAARAVAGNPIVLIGPGEYEIMGVRIKGVGAFHDDDQGKTRGKNTIFSLTIDTITILHLGDLGHKLTDEMIENLPDVDVLLIPTGGFFTIDSKTSCNVVAQLEPKIVIPMHYKPAVDPKNTFEKLEPLSSFLDQMGKKGIQPLPKLSITKDKLPEELEVVVLEK